MTQGTENAPIFVINLDRRTDRLDQISKHLNRFELTWTRISAFDATKHSTEQLQEHYRLTGPLGQISNGAIGCGLSHFHVWQQIVDAGYPAAFILEDDIELADDFAVIARNLSWVPNGVSLVKLEKHTHRKSRKLFGPEIGNIPGTGRQLRRMISNHMGTGGYLITRKAAALALRLKGRPNLPIDHLIFNINVSGLARELSPVQMIPAVLRPNWEIPTDIPLDRNTKKTVLHKLRRGYYGLNLLPRQLTLLALGKAQILEIEFSNGS